MQGNKNQKFGDNERREVRNIIGNTLRQLQLHGGSKSLSLLQFIITYCNMFIYHNAKHFLKGNSSVFVLIHKFFHGNDYKSQSLEHCVFVTC